MNKVITKMHELAKMSPDSIKIYCKEAKGDEANPAHDSYFWTLLILARWGTIEQSASVEEYTTRYLNDVTTAFRAVRSGNVELFNNMLIRGLQINTETNAEGHTFLHAAVASGKLNVLRFLLSKSIDLSVTDLEGNTALHLAVARGNLLAVQVLLRAGASVNAVNFKAETALLKAVQLPNTDIVNELLEAGASYNYVNIYGFTALKYATIYKQTNNIESLLRAGAKN